ncbi:uncharacterized protein BDV14DRAFT_93035 [Aspergillus stella-maris]|uniref:uncharacterized protein n=1 Tax=Aspergillus stella-maris TaxID=1810926 RepID=UPI003CCD418F
MVIEGSTLKTDHPTTRTHQAYSDSAPEPLKSPRRSPISRRSGFGLYLPPFRHPPKVESLNSVSGMGQCCLEEYLIIGKSPWASKRRSPCPVSSTLLDLARQEADIYRHHQREMGRCWEALATTAPETSICIMVQQHTTLIFGSSLGSSRRTLSSCSTPYCLSVSIYGSRECRRWRWFSRGFEL